MKNKLKQVTNKTINELLNRNIILPSIYFEKFNHNAMSIEVNLEDKDFQKEINKILLEDYANIEKYMNSIISNLDILSSSTKEASNALVNKDIEHLHLIYKRLMNLEKNIKKLNDKLFIDDLTNVYNREWIYNKFLTKNSKFKSRGICVYINILDFNYLQKEYGDLIANNLLLFVISFLKKNIKNELPYFKISRFFESQFLIFIEDEIQDEIKNMILNLKQMLLNTTLKSNSGLYIKASYDFEIQSYKKGDEFTNLINNFFDSDKI